MKITLPIFDRYLMIEGNEDEISKIDFCEEEFIEPICGEVKRAFEQLTEYAQGKEIKFDLKLKLQGTPFQKEVWMEMGKIPYAETITYKQLAEKVERPKAFRAVGQACHVNQFTIVLPCHRVVGVNGLTGYFGGLVLKQRLLDHEKKA